MFRQIRIRFDTFDTIEAKTPAWRTFSCESEETSDKQPQEEVTGKS